ncbi:MAG TPA: TorF family putative porin [Casimicrobiaceae bacterium]|nr:TorF family putative porin [Casimicrobiaceae bacterium]
MKATEVLRLTTLAAVVCTAGSALAQTAAPAPAAPPPPEHTLTANVGLFSDYIFRGISQTTGKPAVQGGFDYSHTSGLYLGTWASNISWPSDFGLYRKGGSMEWDFYGGFKNNFPGSDDWGYDLGTLYYYYPGNRFDGVVDIDTWEIYAALNWKFLSAKWSYTVSSDYFGIRPNGQKTDGTWYLDLSGTYPLGESGFALIGHYGHLDVRHDGSGDLEASYDDWKAGASYTIPDGWAKGIEIGAYYTGNNAKTAFYTDLTGYNTAKDTGVVYVKKTF